MKKWIKSQPSYDFDSDELDDNDDSARKSRNGKQKPIQRKKKVKIDKENPFTFAEF